MSSCGRTRQLPGRVSGRLLADEGDTTTFLQLYDGIAGVAHPGSIWFPGQNLKVCLHISFLEVPRNSQFFSGGSLTPSASAQHVGDIAIPAWTFGVHCQVQGVPCSLATSSAIICVIHRGQYLLHPEILVLFGPPGLLDHGVFILLGL